MGSLQGTLWSGVMCTVQMDKLSQNAYESKTTFLYKDKEEVAPMELVDDILLPAKCGIESLSANSKVNTFIESKNLKSVIKCTLEKKKNPPKKKKKKKKKK